MNAPLARWKALCIDAVDVGVATTFWQRILGLEVRRGGDGDHYLAGRDPDVQLWVNAVPEARTVKQRVHLDLEAPSVEPILAAGATMVLPAEVSGYAWSVLSDPEGGELCVFVRDDVELTAPARLYELVVDAHDTASAHHLAVWWADVLAGRVVDSERGFSYIVDVADAPFESIDFVPVPEPKRVKNRVHWDLFAADPSELVRRGATVLREPTVDESWHVMADPDGNEFCAFGPPEGG